MSGLISAFAKRFAAKLGTGLGATLVGFTPNYVAAVSRLLDVKLSEWVTVTDFGADKTGVVDCTQAFNNAVRVARLVTAPPGEYKLNPRHMLYDDGVYSQVTRVGVSIPSNTTLFMYGAKLRSINTNNDAYSMLASFKTTGVSIFGGTLIGDRDANASAGGEYGFGIDFRDVSDALVQDVLSTKMWGDAYYLGVTDTNGNGSSRVTYRNIVGTECRRQGLSITGGRDITVDGYRFININGTAPKAGIDIEPNTTALVENVRLLNGYVEGSGRPILAYKVKGLVIRGLQSVNNDVLFPVLSDRVYDANISDIQARGGAASKYGILWQGVRDLHRVRVSDFSIDGVVLYPVYIEDTAGSPVVDVTFERGQITLRDGTVNTSEINVQNAGSLVWGGVKWVVPAGFDAADAVNLIPANRLLNSQRALWGECEFENRGPVSLAISLGAAGHRGLVVKNVVYSRDALPLSNAWAAVAGYDGASYQKGRDGVVQVFGQVGGGVTADGTVIGTLPVGYRPFAETMCPVVARDGGAIISARSVIVGTDGTIKVDGNMVNNRVSLAGIRFQASGL